MNVITSIHSAGYKIRPLNSAKGEIICSFKMNDDSGSFSGLKHEGSLFCRAKWPLAVYSCFNCSCYLIYRYHVWAKGKCHSLSGIPPPPFQLLISLTHWYPKLGISMRFCKCHALQSVFVQYFFSLCYLKCQKLHNKKPHSEQEHCLSHQGRPGYAWQ